MHQNAGNMSQNFLGKLNTLYSKRAGKIISFLYINDNLWNYFKILLPALSKVFEKVMHRQITDYFNTNNLFSPQQYGFRSNLLSSVILIVN